MRYASLYAVTTLLAVLAGALLVIMGVDWLTIGYGLNPALAFPGALVACAIGTATAIEFTHAVDEYRHIKRLNDNLHWPKLEQR